MKSIFRAAALLLLFAGAGAHAGEKEDARLNAAMGRMGMVKGGTWLHANYTPELLAVDYRECTEEAGHAMFLMSHGSKEEPSDADLDYLIAKLKVCMERKGWKWENPK